MRRRLPGAAVAVIVACPPLVRTAHPDAFWLAVARRTTELGATAVAVDVNAHVVDRVFRRTRLETLLAPLVERFATLERKHRLTGDERRRYAALCDVVPLTADVSARIDGAREGLWQAASYVPPPDGGVIPAIGHRTVHDLATRLLTEALALDAWALGPAALAQDPAPLRPLVALHEEAPPPGSRVLIAVGWERQLPFARALAEAWREGGVEVSLVLRRVPRETLPAALDARPLDALDAPWVGGGGSAGSALEVAPAPWSSALRCWPDAPFAAAAGDPEAHVVPSSLPPALSVVAAEAPPPHRRALATSSGTDPYLEAPPLHRGEGPRLLAEDAMQLVHLGRRDVGLAPGLDQGDSVVPRVSATGRVVPRRHDVSGGGGIGIGRTAPEQMRAGLRLRRVPPLAVDLATGRVSALGADALAALETVDGARSVGEILERLGEGDATRLARASAALAELASAGVIVGRR